MEGRMSVRRTALVLVLGVGSGLSSSIAFADEPTKEECVAANEQAQKLRDRHKLRDAREHLRFCVSKSCPLVLQADCAERLNEVEKALPTIVFVVRNERGEDLTAVRVTMDGARLADRLDGSSLTVDPGEHTFVFESEGFARVESKRLVREGDKDRRENVVLKSAPKPAPPPEPRPEPVPQPTPAPTPPTSDAQPPIAGAEAGSRTPIAAYVALAVGGLGVVAGSVFGVIALGKKSSLDSACGSDKTACPPAFQSDIDALHRNAVISNVGFGVGLVGLGVGGVLLLMSGGSKSESAPEKSAVVVRPTVGFGTLGMNGVF